MLVNLKTILLLAHFCALCLGACNDECSTSAPPEAPGYKFAAETGHRYKFHREGARWKAANRTCVSEGAHLAIINSAAEAKVLKELFRENYFRMSNADIEFWVAIGIYREPATRSDKKTGCHCQGWKTVDGQTLDQAGYSSWYEGHPWSYSHTDYGYMMYSGELANNNDEETTAFICEKNKHTRA